MGSGGRDRSLLLCGMMGAGKSAVGRTLAARLGREFVDTDKRIEATYGASIAEIFAAEGEHAFRGLESDVLRGLPETGAVIGLGGGAVVSERNREVLASKGTLVWLDATPETLAGRIGSTARRPLLHGLDMAARIERLRALREERKDAYAHAALHVTTDGCSLDEAADRVLAALGWEDAA